MSGLLSLSLSPHSSATSRAQRASARNLTALGAPEASIPLESVASTSQLIPDSDPLAPGPDSDDAMMSGSNSVPPGEEVGYNASNARARREKGKDKERDSGVRVKDEPVAFALQSFEPSPALVSATQLTGMLMIMPISCSPTKITVRRADLLDP